MNNRRIVISLFLFLTAAALALALVSSASATQFVEPACPDVIQRGELRLTIPAGSTSASVEQPFIRCADISVQATGGTLNRTPVIINAVVHHDRLLLTAALLSPEPGPTDATIWWRVD